MNNKAFYRMLYRERDTHNRPIWTVARIAREIGSGRPHVIQVLSNDPKRGLKTRWRLAKCFRQNFEEWQDMLLTLGWKDELKAMQVLEWTRTVLLRRIPEFHKRRST